jgi:hypothetical protein
MDAGRERKESGKLVDRVNPLQGTNSSSLFSRGNTLPIVALPFGMAHWTLQSNAAQQPWFFRPEDNRIEGLRCTHQLSPWLSDYGFRYFFAFYGVAGDRSWGKGLVVSTHGSDGQATPPCCYSLWLQHAPSAHGTVRMTFNESGPAGLMIDLPGEDAEFHAEPASGVVSALTRANAGGVSQGVCHLLCSPVRNENRDI